MKKNTGIITQARMTSTRLPGKVLLEVGNRSLLQIHIDRLKRSGLDIVIATTVNNSDDPICELAEREKIKYHRGSEQNVLSRFYETASKYQFDNIVRVTSDCPLIAPRLIHDSVEKFTELDNPNLYMSNVVERTFARGIDFEIFSFESLRDAFFNAKDESDLEHVTPYIRNNKSGKIEFFHVKQETDNSRLRITVDTEEDFQLIKLLIEKYNAAKLGYSEIEKILIQHPELVKLNAHIAQKEA